MSLPPSDNFQFEIFKKFSAHEAYPIAKKWLEYLLGLTPVNHVEITGELRRCKSTVRQIDLILDSEHPEQVHDVILSQNGYKEVLSDSDSQVNLLLPAGMPLRIWITKPENYASMLLISTGSENHIANMTRRGILFGFDFKPDGIWKSGQPAEFKNERDIYSSIDLPWIPPELRESGDEIEQAKDLDLNGLVKSEDILSDLHMHSTWTDGRNSIEEMAAAAIDRGLSFIAICDHSPYMFEKYKDGSYLLEQALEINKIQKTLKNGFEILRGVEVDILPDGTLDLPDEMLMGMDMVVASMHVELDQTIEKATARMIRAIENPFVNIIGHPGGRIYPMEDVSDLDWERVIRAAAYNKVALEINSHKSHPIFDDQKARAAADAGALISINSDSHSVEMMANYHFGIAIARRAGLKREQVINTWTLNHLKLWARQKKDTTARVQ